MCMNCVLRPESNINRTQLSKGKDKVYDQFSSMGSHLSDALASHRERKELKAFSLADPYHMQARVWDPI